MIALVRGVTFAATKEGSMLKLCRFDIHENWSRAAVKHYVHQSQPT